MKSHLVFIKCAVYIFLAVVFAETIVILIRAKCLGLAGLITITISISVACIVTSRLAIVHVAM